MGFFMKPSDLFQNFSTFLRDNPTNKEAHIKLREIFDFIQKTSNAYGHSKDDFEGLFDGIDPKNQELGKTHEAKSETIRRFLDAVENFELKLGDVSVDVFGEFYEHLMFFFANIGGKTGGEFFTPQEVSELLVGLTTIYKNKDVTVYDPACGTGSLLINFVKKLGADQIDSLFGQELNPNTYNLCRMNMFIHDLSYDKFSIKVGDTLVSEFGHKKQYKDINKDFKVDIVVSNPPYSQEWTPINEQRFKPTGEDLPKKPADYAFILHGLSCLKDDGVAAFVCPLGVLFRGNVEGRIREHLIKDNIVDAVITLPKKIFMNTDTPTCILLLNKNKKNTDIMFIDATQEFQKYGRLNYITNKDFDPENNNVDNILNCYKERKSIPGFSYVATAEEVIENECVLLVDNYVTPLVDLENEVQNLNIEKITADLDALTSENKKLQKNISNFAEFFKSFQEGK